MPSLRKRHRGNGSEASESVVETVSPIDQAAQTAIEQKLEEQASSPLKQQINALSAAEKLHRAQATEAPSQMPRFPEVIEKWLSAHPEYLSDRIKNLELMLAHERAVRDGVTALDAPEYLPSIERHLGLVSTVAPEPATPAPAEEAPAPPAPQPHQGFAVSAPISRDAPSMTTGRPMGTSAVKLTAEEAAFARSQNISLDEYLKQKIKMTALKRAGAIQS